MVAVLCRPGTTTAEARLHLALAGSPCHAFAALLAAEAPDRVAAPDVPGSHDGGHDYQADDESGGKRHGDQDAVEHPH